MVKNLTRNLSANPEDMKKFTKRYSIRRPKMKNRTIATTPFGAVHLRNKRFRGSSEVTMVHLVAIFYAFT